MLGRDRPASPRCRAPAPHPLISRLPGTPSGNSVVAMDLHGRARGAGALISARSRRSSVVLARPCSFCTAIAKQMDLASVALLTSLCFARTQLIHPHLRSPLPAPQTAAAPFDAPRLTLVSNGGPLRGELRATAALPRQPRPILHDHCDDLTNLIIRRWVSPLPARVAV